MDVELRIKLLSVLVQHNFKTKNKKENLKFTKVTEWKIVKLNLGSQQYFTLNNVYGTCEIKFSI